MNKLSFLFMIITLAFVAGCSSTQEDSSDEAMNTDEYANMEEFKMDEFGLNLKLLIPNEDMARGKPEVNYNDALGYYSLQIGSRFNVQIYDNMDPDVEGIKASVESSNFYKEYEYLTDEPGLLIYSQTLPDESRTFYHFYHYKEVGGVKYVFKDDDISEFTKMSVETMMKSLNTLEPTSAS